MSPQLLFSTATITAASTSTAATITAGTSSTAAVTAVSIMTSESMPVKHLS